MMVSYIGTARRLPLLQHLTSWGICYTFSILAYLLLGFIETFLAFSKEIVQRLFISVTDSRNRGHQISVAD